MSDEVVIYSSSIGGTVVRGKTQRLEGIVHTILQRPPRVIYIDQEGTDEMKKMIREKAGKMGVWPLLFRGDKYIGTLEECIDMNEYEELKPLLL